MIKARTRQDGCLIALELTGHAEYAPNGKDIVCAAVSILVSTVCNLLPTARHKTFEDDTTIIFLRDSKPERDYLRYIAVGLAQLAKTYPDNVNFVDDANALS